MDSTDVVLHPVIPVGAHPFGILACDVTTTRFGCTAVDSALSRGGMSTCVTRLTQSPSVRPWDASMHSSHILQRRSVAPIVSQCEESLLGVGPVHYSPLASGTCVKQMFGFTLPEPQVLDAQRGYLQWITADLLCFEALCRSWTPPCADGPTQFVLCDYMHAFALLVPSKVQVGSWCRGFDWHNAV
jgi:hypothetical protein